MKVTLFAWSSRRLLVEIFDDSREDFVGAVKRLHRKLRLGRDDFRWQCVDRELAVLVSNRTKRRGRPRKAVRK